MMFGIGWIWLVVGTLGVGGTVAALVFAPAVAVPIVQAALRFLLGTRIGVGLLVGIAAFAVADIHRSRLDQRDWAAKTAAFQQAQTARDLNIAASTRAQVMKEIADEAASKAASDEQVKEIKDALPTDKNEACADLLHVGDNADRLRELAGQPKRQPASPQRMPKARRGRSPPAH